MKKRILSFILAFSLLFSVFIPKPTYALTGVEELVAVILALAASAGITVVGTSDEAQNAFAGFVDQSNLKESLLDALSTSTGTIGTGVQMSASFLELLPSLYDELRAYFGKGYIVDLEGPYHDLVGTLPSYYPSLAENVFKGPAISDLSLGTLVSTVKYNCGCVLSTYFEGNLINKGRVYGHAYRYVGSWGHDAASTYGNAYTTPFDAMGFDYYDYGNKYIYLNLFSGAGMIGNGNSVSMPKCPHSDSWYSVSYRIAFLQIASVYCLGTTLIFTEQGYDTLPMLPTVADTLIPRDLWLEGFMAGTAVLNPGAFGGVLGDYEDIYNPSVGLVTGVDIPGYVDKEIGWIYNPDITNPDIPANPDIDVPDVPATGVTGLLQKILGLLTGISAAIANAVVGTGSLNFDGLTKIKFASVFPFCIPFDFIHMFDQFAVSPIEPIFEIDFKGTPLAPVGVFKIDLTQFSMIFSIIRFFIYASFVVGLIILTRKIIKG